MAYFNSSKIFLHRQQSSVYKIVFALIFCILSQPLMAHVVVKELEKLSRTDLAWEYLKLGFTHIIPLGWDHIFFVLGLCLLSPKLKPVLWQASAFTVAHSFTLGLAMYHIISPPAHIVEPLIALSILYVSLENIFSPRLKTSRIGIVFLFGLIHGLGFAGSLGQLGLPPNAYLLSLIMFNGGVELGQVSIILCAYFLIGKWFGNKTYYRGKISVPISSVIAVVAGFWTIQRILF